jgi:hypothetical protein
VPRRYDLRGARLAGAHVVTLTGPRPSQA